MSSPSSTKDLQDEHCPSLQPCMSMMPCSKAERRIVCSSSTSISMPTGSNRTTCLSAMVPSQVSRCARPWASRSVGKRRRAEGLGRRPSFLIALCLYCCWLGRRSRVDREAAGGAGAVVLRHEGLAVFRRHLVEQDVGALQRRAPAQVVQRPHLLLVAQLQMRLRGHGL